MRVRGERAVVVVEGETQLGNSPISFLLSVFNGTLVNSAKTPTGGAAGGRITRMGGLPWVGGLAACTEITQSSTKNPSFVCFIFVHMGCPHNILPRPLSDKPNQLRLESLDQLQNVNA